MNLPQAIQQKWNQTDALTAQVPGERVFVGAAPGSAVLPHVTIVPQAQEIEPTTTRDYLERRRVRIGARAETYPAAHALRELFDRTYHREPLPLGFDTLLALSRTGGGEDQEPAGWHAWYEYEALIERRS